MPDKRKEFKAADGGRGTAGFQQDITQTAEVGLLNAAQSPQKANVGVFTSKRAMENFSAMCD